MALTLPRGILWRAHDVFAHAPVDPLFYGAGRAAPPDEQGGLLALFTEILPEYFA